MTQGPRMASSSWRDFGRVGGHSSKLIDVVKDCLTIGVQRLYLLTFAGPLPSVGPRAKGRRL